jgi:hypothetical protein
MFRSGPWHCDLPNLETPGAGTVVKSFQVPNGTKLVSHGMRVTASAKPIEDSLLSFITDGDLDSATDAILVLPPGQQWVQVDLGKSMRIEKVHLWHDQRRSRNDVYRDVVVELGQDAGFSDIGQIIFNADYRNVHGRGQGPDPAYIETNFGRLMDGGSHAARFVRIWGSGSYNDGFHRYVEVQVYARAVE